MSELSAQVVPVKWQKLHPAARIPKKASAHAACFDLHAAMEEEMTIEPGKVALIPTGLAVEIPPEFELQLRARSGLAAKFGLTLVNGIGTIDADYRGEIKCIVALLGSEPLTIRPGERICQAALGRVIPVEHLEVQNLTESERGAGGFGSTGVTP